MGRLGRELTGHAILGLDTSVFIYHLEANPTYLPLTKELLTGVQEGRWQAITSTITVMELTVPAWRHGQGGAARQYETLLVNFPNLRLLDITRDVARRAAQLRARFRLRPADALQVAAGLEGGATTFVSNDARLSRLESIIQIVLLDNYC